MAKLKTFFERVMRAACGPVRESDVIRAQIAATQGRRDSPQNGPRSARRAQTKKHTRRR